MISRSHNKNITFISKRGKPMYEKRWLFANFGAHSAKA